MDFAVAIPALVGAVSALVVRAGERVIERVFDGSVKREELRDADLQAMERVVWEIRDLATAYWAKDADGPNDDLVAASIVGRLTFVAGVIEELFRSRVELLRKAHVLTNRFDTACTLGAFGSKVRKAEPNRCRDIEIAAYSLVHQTSRLRRRL